jgi:shikimate dehydrogenase
MPVTVRPTAVRDHRCPIVGGVEMLVQLATQISERWTGLRPEEAVFQRAVAAALGEAD